MFVHLDARNNEEKTIKNLTFPKIERKGSNKIPNLESSKPRYLQKTFFVCI